MNATSIYQKFFSQQSRFLLGITNLNIIPNLELPEVAFFGRSNVGKSSLINTLLNRKSLVKVSKKPGKTKEINLFNIGDNFIIADLPGYGYAAVDLTTKNLWQQLVLDYLTYRQSLLRIYLLIDSRHGMKPIDLEIMGFLDKIPKSYAIVLTKIDKIKNLELEELIHNIKGKIRLHGAAFPEILISSVKTKNLLTLQENIYNLLHSN